MVVCSDRLQATLGNVVEVYLPYCWGLVNTVSQPVKCQHPFFFLSDKALGAGGEPSSQSIQKVRGRRRGEKEFVSPQGKAEWDGIVHTPSSAEERLSLWNKAFNLCLRVLCGVYNVRERQEKTWEKERKGVKNSVWIPGNPSHLLSCQQAESWEIILPPRPCLFPLPLYFSSILSYLSLTPQPCPPQNRCLSLLVVPRNTLKHTYKIPSNRYRGSETDLKRDGRSIKRKEWKKMNKVEGQ